MTYKGPEKLTYRPPNRKNSQQVLVCFWYEFYPNGEDTISFNRLILEFVNGHVELKTN